MKIVFMGTPDFAVDTLKALIEHHEVVGVFTQPDKPKGRGKKLAPPPVKEVALAHDLKVFQPEKIKVGDWAQVIRDLSPDVLVVVAYGQILSKEILEIAPYGAINVHASLLPKYRGAAPINWAIINGETETGITTMQMDVGLDTGDMLLKSVRSIDDDITAGELFEALAGDGAALLIQTLQELEAKTLSPEKQDDSLSTYASMIRKEMAEIDFNKSAQEVKCAIRGFSPWPVAYTLYKGERLKVFKASVVDAEMDKTIGKIVEVTSDQIRVQTAKGLIAFEEIQLGSNKRMPVKAFLLGRTIEVGEILGEVEA